MEDSASVPVPTQTEQRWDLMALFRGAITIMLECLLEQEVREMVGARRVTVRGTAS